MIPLKCNNLNFSVKKFCCAFDHSEVRKYLLIQLYCELQNTEQKRGSRHICKMHRESHFCFQILSLASSITTLFPLRTIIPILFCPPALGNSMAHGVTEDQVHEWIKSTEGSLNLTAAVDSQTDPLVHEFLQLWGMVLRHACWSFLFGLLGFNNKLDC